MSQLFIVDDEQARPAEATSLPDAKLKERDHLQEWVIDNPSVLGEDVMVIASEYNHWAAESDGVPARDRLDVLGIDGAGRLVVVELKRGVAARDIHLQAITYASLVSRFTLETLAQANAVFLTRRLKTTVAVDEARSRILDHVGDDLDPDVLKRPRLVLIASSFPKQVTSSVVWLSEMSLDISLVQVSLWRVADQLVADFSTIYPVPEVEEFTLGPERVKAGEVGKRIEQRARSKNIVQLLVESGFIPAGTELRIVPHGMVAETRETLEAWLDDDNARRSALWTGEAPKAIRWRGEDYTPTGLANEVLGQATRSKGAIQGPAWFVLADPSYPTDANPEQWDELQGKTLVDIAQRLGLYSYRERRAPIIDRLLAADEPSEGQALTIVVPPIKQDVDGIRAWLASEPKRGIATWRQDADAQVVWAFDEQTWDMKELAREILRQSLGVDADKVWGPNWFQVADGRTLSKIADALQ
ncbi:hypothetical protein [Actinomycetospora sp. NBRC 106378]|uniref:hypothetical protein n=1 Tax=Actinomycetospora sp. NBRC 106378 TaxID=3032208 RepID=UPI0024A51C45|nr:hypothetical protein [Actinomycetospora sp. NBRC 106378]GLZ51348.1 hypothetical protein Acsp07_09650 [Actinomycetospora sp. NBRC 106378]